jgi:hypothetical protein
MRQPQEGVTHPGTVDAAPPCRRRKVIAGDTSCRAGSGRDAHKAVDGKTSAVLQVHHIARVIARQQTAAHERAQQPPALIPVDSASQVRDRGRTVLAA